MAHLSSKVAVRRQEMVRWPSLSYPLCSCLCSPCVHALKSWATLTMHLSIWHVLLSEHEEVKGVVEEVILRLRAAGVIYSNLDSVWNAIVKADVSIGRSACQRLHAEPVVCSTDKPLLLVLC